MDGLWAFGLAPSSGRRFRCYRDLATAPSVRRRPRELVVEARNEQVAALEAAFTDALLARLVQPNRTLIRGDGPDADVVLHAELADIDYGQRFMRAYSRGERA